jgi:hypothetical protein
MFDRGLSWHSGALSVSSLVEQAWGGNSMLTTLKCASLWAIIIGCSIASANAQDSDAERQLMVKLMQDTKITAVTSVTDPAKFVDDKDPNTLEIVMLDDPKLGESRVSDDGEVIFDNGSSDDEQQNLITRAFEIRARLRIQKQ